MHRLVLVLLCLLTLALPAPAQETAIKAIASLTDPQKLATLRSERAANDRLLKCIYWLSEANSQGHNAVETITEA